MKQNGVNKEDHSMTIKEKTSSLKKLKSDITLRIKAAESVEEDSKKRQKEVEALIKKQNEALKDALKKEEEEKRKQNEAIEL